MVIWDLSCSTPDYIRQGPSPGPAPPPFSCCQYYCIKFAQKDKSGPACCKNSRCDIGICSLLYLSGFPPAITTGLKGLDLKPFCVKEAEVGKQTFLISLQIANPQIFGLLPLSQFRKCLRCASPQILNSQIFMNNPQIANPQVLQISDLSQNSPEIVLFNDF